MAKIRAESLLRRPLRGISTCLTAATVRSTSTTELPTRKIASPQSYTETSILSLFASALCRKQQRIQPETLLDTRFWKTAWFASETTGPTERTDREGSDPGRWYRGLTVEVSTEEEIQILTNLLWIDAEQICRLYRH